MAIFKRLAALIVTLAVIAGVGFLADRTSVTKDYFHGELSVTWTKYKIPLPGVNESVSINVHKSGEYGLLFVGTGDRKNATVPTVLPLVVNDPPQAKVIEQSAFPDHMWITVISSNSGLEVHEFQ